MSDRRSMPSSFDDDREYQETAWQKVSRKLREEPLIPLGASLTVYALYNAWRAMRRGDHHAVQRSFRARVAAQAFTILAAVGGGAYYREDREKRRELIKLEGQKRAEERHQKWLHELEVRDEEDKQVKAAMDKKRQRLEAKRAAAAANAEQQGSSTTATDVEKDPNLASSTSPTTTMNKAPSPSGASSSENKKDADAPSSKESSKVLSALSGIGGWFGSKKGESPQPTEPSETDTKSSKN